MLAFPILLLIRTYFVLLFTVDVVGGRERMLAASLTQRLPAPRRPHLKMPRKRHILRGRSTLGQMCRFWGQIASFIFFLLHFIAV